MSKLEFDHHRVPARKGLINFLEENGEKSILKRIGENPNAWIEELSLISQVVTKSPLVCGTGIFQPPIGDPNFREIGNKTYFYDGKESRLEGIWIREDFDPKTAKMMGKLCEWSNYRTKISASLKINKEFANISSEEFLPENFEKKGKRLEDAKKRPIWHVQIRGRNLYAKTSEMLVSQYFEHTKPSYRLTYLSSVQKATSKSEMKKTENLGNFGVNVPTIFAYYESPFEEVLFVGEVEGKQPPEFFETHRQEIIKQDAEMLANVLRAGYRKQYFGDFDDKVFDGEKLWLIDVDECSDLYYLPAVNFREILLDPMQKDSVRKFRRLQKKIFETMLRDNIYVYQKTLTPRDQDKEDYVKSFYQTLGWKIPSERKMQDFLTFSDDYQTIDNYMSAMADCD